MEFTKSFIRVYNITPGEAENFEYDYTVEGCDPCTDLSVMLVPDERDHGNLAWGIRDAEDYEYEYSEQNETIHFSLDTKWEPPLEWLLAASEKTPYFKDKVITMATIQKDETCVTGIAVKNGDVLQNKQIFTMPLEEVVKYYDDEDESYDLDSLDNQIWDSIGSFLDVCEKFYIKGEQQ